MSTRELKVVTPAGAEELRGVPEILSHSFGVSEQDGLQWLSRHDPANLRLVADAGAESGDGGLPLGCLMQIPMGQFFGGRSVPMVGIAGVAVAPEARGGGVATTLMRRCVQELNERGVALSCLYPATQPVYRRAGYEQAGHLCRVSFKAGLAPRQAAPGADAVLRPATDDDRGSIRALYRRQATRQDGNIDRSEMMWDRVVNPRGTTTRCYVVQVGGAIQGYAYLRIDVPRSPDDKPNLVITDVAGETADACRKLLAFIGEHRAQEYGVRMHAGPTHPLLVLLDEQRYQVAKKDCWMLRITHAARALTGRGYPAGQEARLDLEIDDGVIAANSGRWTLRISGGRAALDAGGAGSLKTDARGLAMLYTGYMSPWAMRQAGLIEGDDGATAAAAAVFAATGGAPWMSDQF